MPTARRLVEATVGTDEHLWARAALARLTRLVNTPAGLRDARQVMAEAIAADQYYVAILAAEDVIIACRATGRIADALAACEARTEYIRRAGLDVWAELSNDTVRLQILTDQGENELVLTEVDRLLIRAQTLANNSDNPKKAVPFEIRERLLDTGREAAEGLQQWERALTFTEGIAVSQQRRGALLHQVARTKFTAARPLLELGRIGEALTALRECREVFEADGNMHMLGIVLDALANVEDSRQHGRAALALELNALRMIYQTRDSRGAASIHHNYGIYLARYTTNAAAAATHYLAAALLYSLTGSNVIDDSLIMSLARELADISDPATLPPTTAALSRAVNQTDGVHLDHLLDALVPDPTAHQHALDRILTRARDLFNQTPVN